MKFHLHRSTLLLLPLFLPMTGCGGGDHGHDHPHPHPDEEAGEGDHEAGPHGGELVEVGDHVGHLELLRDRDAHRLTLHLYGGDAKTPLAAEGPPEVKLVTEGGPVVVTCEVLPDGVGEGSSFVADHDALAAEVLEGRVTLRVGGKVYNPEL